MSKQRNGHITMYGYDAEGNALYKAKIGYVRENDALLKCFQLNLQSHTIHKAVANKSSVCGKWHIGHHSGNALTDIDREKIKIKFERFKILNGIK